MIIQSLQLHTFESVALESIDNDINENGNDYNIDNDISHGNNKNDSNENKIDNNKDYLTVVTTMKPTRMTGAMTIAAIMTTTATTTMTMVMQCQ